MTYPIAEGIAASLIKAVEARRSTPRVNVNAEVDLSSETNFFSGFSTDIGSGGLFIATLATLPVGTEVDVKFSLPNGAEISTSGEVRWTRVFDERRPEMLPGMGVQFVDLSPKARRAIEDFVSRREPMFFPD